MVDPIITTTLSILSAVIIAILGYLKNRPSEDFDKTKALHTIVIGVAVGIVQVMLGITPGSAEGWVVMFLVNTGIIDTVEKLLRALWGAYQNRERGGRTMNYITTRQKADWKTK